MINLLSKLLFQKTSCRSFKTGFLIEKLKSEQIFHETLLITNIIKKIISIKLKITQWNQIKKQSRTRTFLNGFPKRFLSMVNRAIGIFGMKLSNLKFKQFEATNLQICFLPSTLSYCVNLLNIFKLFTIDRIKRKYFETNFDGWRVSNSL